jgi:hypothetical protein
MENFSRHPLYRSHNLDSAISSLLDFYKKHFLVLFLTSFVMALIVQIITAQIKIGDMTSLTDPMQMLEKYKSFIVPYLEILAVSMIFNLVLQYYVMYNPLEGHPTFPEAIYKSMKYLPAYLIISVLFIFMTAIAMVFGILLFIVGIFFAVLWAGTIFMFILPVLMAEGTNIGNGITRIFRLAHKNLWSNLGWVALSFLMLIVISFILGALIMIPFSGSFLKILTHPEEAKSALDFMTNPYYIGLSALASAITAPVVPILSAILYFNGRARETEKLTVVNSNEPEKVRVEDLYAKPYSDDHPDNPDNVK